MSAKFQTSIRLSLEAVEMVNKLCDIYGFSKTDAIETCIRRVWLEEEKRFAERPAAPIPSAGELIETG